MFKIKALFCALLLVGCAGNDDAADPVANDPVAKAKVSANFNGSAFKGRYVGSLRSVSRVQDGCNTGDGWRDPISATFLPYPLEPSRSGLLYVVLPGHGKGTAEKQSTYHASVAFEGESAVWRHNKGRVIFTPRGEGAMDLRFVRKKDGKTFPGRLFRRALEKPRFGPVPRWTQELHLGQPWEGVWRSADGSVSQQVSITFHDVAVEGDGVVYGNIDLPPQNRAIHSASLFL